MHDNNNSLHDHEVLGQIAILSAKGLSGRLDVAAGATTGALLFNNGRLVDARVGHLTGFQAINAIASIRDASFHFDPSVAPPASSSINASERVVLKQFFGIDTVDTTSVPARVAADEVEETTVVRSHHVTSTAPLPAWTIEPPSRFPYLTVFALIVLFVAIGAAAVLLRSEFRERTAQAPVATTTSESVPLPVPAAKTEVPAPQTAELRTPVVRTPEVRTPEVQSVEPNVNDKATASAPAATAADLSGSWNVVNTVQTTGYRSFQNLKIGFALSINQTGRTFTARGQKISENGRSLPADSRTPIQVKGIINGDRVEATFSEQGSARNTNGRFVWTIDPAGKGLRGTFSSSAARTSGKSAAIRDF